MANSKNNIPVEQLKVLFTCDFETGAIYHKAGCRSVRPGTIAGTTARGGYRRIKHAGISYSAHRVIWAMYHGAWPENVLDHRDGNPSNNSISNLREATPVTNAANRKAIGGSSPLKGVTWHKGVQKWQAQFVHNGKCQYLGLFGTEKEAHRAYMTIAKEVHGDFVRGSADV